jgi:hypothetical protein
MGVPEGRFTMTVPSEHPATFLENVVNPKFAMHGFAPLLFQGYSGRRHARRRASWNHWQPS